MVQSEIFIRGLPFGYCANSGWFCSLIMCFISLLSLMSGCLILIDDGIQRLHWCHRCQSTSLCCDILETCPPLKFLTMDGHLASLWASRQRSPGKVS
ncbi:hypothetical protein K439DRAFT_1060161 [Ramaria rubella]|nr:hypothetical protein K439DRAFT_1060161 [Ramaria rubella]